MRFQGIEQGGVEVDRAFLHNKLFILLRQGDPEG